MARTAYLAISAALFATAVLGGCSTAPSTIVSDDDAFCRYTAEVAASDTYSRCRARLDGQHVRVAAAAANRIEGYALLNGPAVAPATDTAGRCSAPDAPKDCASDITGTIPAKPAH
ncbi:MAG: hypothetical protein WC670_17340 [Pseudolabrys sp.]|jgi:starvation-inducible outer membrane lipoprotein